MWFFLAYYPVIFLLGLITSYEDLKKGIIRNKWVFASIVYSLFVLLLFSITSFVKSGAIDSIYLLTYFTNVAFSLLAAVLFWIVHLWSAGDAKLFTAYSFLIPLNVYVYGYEKLFPSIAILVNVFVPLFIFYFLRIIFKQTPKKTINSLKMAFEPKKVFYLFISFFAISWPLFFLSRINILFSNLFLVVIIIFLVMSLLELFVPGEQIKWLLVVALLRVVFDRSIFSFYFWRFFFSFFITYLILRYFILGLSFNYFVKQIYIENLKPGMMLAQKIIKKGKSYVLEDAFFTNLFEGLKKQKGKEIVLGIKTLTNKEVKFIQNAHSQGKIKQHNIKVQEFVSFALFLFVGVLLTLLFRGDIINFLINLIGSFL